MRRYLGVIERAYRGTVEEQYGHILWICFSLHRMGGPIGVLLRGNAVLYARQDQQQLSMSVGGIPVSLPNYEVSVKGLLAEGAPVYALSSDLDRLQIAPDELCTGVMPIDAAGLPDLFSTYDVIWYW